MCVKIFLIENKILEKNKRTLIAIYIEHFIFESIENVTLINEKNSYQNIESAMGRTTLH